MFSQLIESTSARPKTKTPVALAAALVIHVTILGALLLIPMITPQILSAQLPKLTFLAPPPPPLGTPHGTTPQKRNPGPVHIREEAVLQVPQKVPHTLSSPELTGAVLLIQNGPVEPLAGFASGLSGGIPGGVAGLL